VFNEISPNLVKKARQRTTLLSADLQGFVRTVSDDGTVKNVKRDLQFLFQTCDLVKASQNEAEMQFQTMNRKMILRRMLREGLQYALLTLGKKGCLIATRESNRMWHVPAFLDPQVKDSTGAGDILIGCWLSIYLELQDPVWATSVGSALSSLTSRRMGLSKFNFSRYELFRRASWVYNRVKESTLS
jgi:sugar/nucleoside kinase (ribokinase family)